MGSVILTALAMLCMGQGHRAATAPTDPSPSVDPEENKFFALAATIASDYNLTDCWVCGDPDSLDKWPWVAGPVEPRWLVSSPSETHNGTGFWPPEQFPRAWVLERPTRGEYCLNRTQKEGGVWLGESTCEWTLTLAKECIFNSPDRKCTQELNCDDCKGYWNSTHYQLTNSTWVTHRQVQDLWGRPPQGAPNSLFRTCSDTTSHQDIFVCIAQNSTQHKLSPEWWRWQWQHNNGTRKMFTWYWAAEDRTGNGTSVSCSPEDGAWRCRYTAEGAVTNPLGPSDTLYFDAPRHKGGLIEKWAPDSGLHWSPFPKGRPALKGHYWICGNRAYRALPANWTGVCFIGYARPRFFLLPGRMGSELGVKAYDNLGRARRSVDTSVSGCLKIDDNGKLIRQLTKNMQDLAHVPVQTWEGWNADWLSWLPGSPWLRLTLFSGLVLLGVLFVLPRLTPCLFGLI